MKYTWIEQDNSSTKTELSIGVSSKFGKDDNTTVNGSIKVTISAVTAQNITLALLGFGLTSYKIRYILKRKVSKK